MFGSRSSSSSRPPRVLWSAAANDDDDDDDGTAEGIEEQQRIPVSYRSISDYMGGWHAGKYDFDTRISGVTSLNYEKSIVFGNTAKEATAPCVAPPPDMVPTWAQQGPEYNEQDATADDIPILQLDETGHAVVAITNEEISWEPFYVSVLLLDGDNNSNAHYQVSPKSGTLAPRGGSGSYSDMCEIHIVQATRTVITNNNETLLLIARTEERHWAWHLVLRARGDQQK